MDVSAITSIDNITDVLRKIISFTKQRKDILTRNMLDFKEPGFEPKDLPVLEFTEQMTLAIAEHMRNDRLIVRDTDNIRFGADGVFDPRPVVDTDAKQLLQKDQQEYLHYQIEKLSENLINHKVAIELLKQKQRRDRIFE